MTVRPEIIQILTKFWNLSNDIKKRTENNWIHWNWIESNSIELVWIDLNRFSLNWIKLIWVEHTWCQLNWKELNFISVDLGTWGRKNVRPEIIQILAKFWNISKK